MVSLPYSSPQLAELGLGVGGCGVEKIGELGRDRDRNGDREAQRERKKTDGKGINE